MKNEKQQGAIETADLKSNAARPAEVKVQPKLVARSELRKLDKQVNEADFRSAPAPK
jgi:hypothetical protein